MDFQSTFSFDFGLINDWYKDNERVNHVTSFLLWSDEERGQWGCLWFI